MEFLILRALTQSELGFFHEYRRQGKETSKQRAINFDGKVVARVFPAATKSDRIPLELTYETDSGAAMYSHSLKRQGKNWRLEGHCPNDKKFSFVSAGSLFVLRIQAGISPAKGTWTVLDAESPLTQEILADGGTRGLAAAGMIALHGRQSAHLLSKISEALPAPSTDDSGQEVQMSDQDDAGSEGGVSLPPRALRLTEMLADTGHTFAGAVSDLVDNSISANAIEINIHFGRPDQGNGRWMTIADNGDGMSWEELKEAMRIGSETDYEEGSLGKYGFGLKGASWSQANLLTVVTKQAGEKASHLTWDKSKIDESWTACNRPLDDWVRDATDPGEHGTVVMWRDMTVPESTPSVPGASPYVAEVRDLKRHLALVFHRFLEGKVPGKKKVEILVNDEPVPPNNPVGHPLVREYDTKTVKVPVSGGTAPVVIAPYLLPSEDELKQYHAPTGDADKAIDAIGLHGKRTETQGLFIYRNGRLIRWGGWHQIWATTDEKTKLARVTVDFGPELDKAFQINISKQIVHLPPMLQDAIKPLAKFARTDSQAKFRRGSQPPVPAPSPPSPTPPSGGPKISVPPTSPPGSGPAPAPRTPSPPALVVRPVETSKFVWKLSRSLNGAEELQVSRVNSDLAELARLLAPNTQAATHLAAFLTQLDEIGAQDELIGKA
ncbi:ATP-binding protein [Sphingomonas humi]